MKYSELTDRSTPSKAIVFCNHGIHPIWSLDRNDWVPLGELEQGEQLHGTSGAAVVLTHTILHRTTPVYNIEAHGEHVYQVGELELLVHNACIDRVVDIRYLKPSAARDIADPAKLARRGEFNWNLYKPIELVKSGAGYQIMIGMTRVEAAMRAGITHLPAKIFLP